MVVDATSVLDQVVNILFWVFGIAIIGICFFFVSIIGKYKHTIVIREVMNRRKIVSVDKFRVWTDPKTGIEWYNLLKFKKKIPVAPKDSLEVTKKGRMFCEAYMLPNGDIIYLRDETTDIDNIDKDDNFKPITSSQRVIQYHLYENKMKHKRKSWKDLIIPIVGILALTTIVIALMIFWGDLAKPVLDMGGQMASITEKQGEITDSLKEIIQKEQVLDEQTPISNKPPN